MGYVPNWMLIEGQPYFAEPDEDDFLGNYNTYWDVKYGTNDSDVLQRRVNEIEAYGFEWDMQRDMIVNPLNGAEVSCEVWRKNRGDALNILQRSADVYRYDEEIGF